MIIELVSIYRCSHMNPGCSLQLLTGINEAIHKLCHRSREFDADIAFEPLTEIEEDHAGTGAYLEHVSSSLTQLSWTLGSAM